MARQSDDILPAGVELSLTLDRYQELMPIPMAAFNGLLKDHEAVEYQCPAIWKQSDRDYLAIYLSSAEERRERELGYHLGPKYTLDEIVEDSHNPIILKFKHMIAVGAEAFSDIALGVPLVLSDIGTGAIYDPVTIVVPTTLLDTTEICVTYPGDLTPIHPSKVSIAGGNVTIDLPRSRLVDPANDDNREDPLHYDDDAIFLTEVDVHRKYTDPSLGIAYYHMRSDFTEHTFGGVGKILNPRLAIISAWPASWSGTTPAALRVCGGYPMRITYLSGRRYSITTELQTCRLAHTLMPHEPCTCNEEQMYWIEDQVDSKTITPYGRSVGALDAWVQDSRGRTGVGGMLR